MQQNGLGEMSGDNVGIWSCHKVGGDTRYITGMPNYFPHGGVVVWGGFYSNKRFHTINTHVANGLYYFVG